MIILRFLVNLVIFLIPAALLGRGCYDLSVRSRDEWKLIAWVPVLPLAIWAPWIAWGLARDKTSHNLWPFELVVWAALSLVMMAFVLLARWLFGGPRTDFRGRRM
jgi:hypothetical protein